MFVDKAYVSQSTKNQVQKEATATATATATAAVKKADAKAQAKAQAQETAKFMLIVNYSDKVLHHDHSCLSDSFFLPHLNNMDDKLYNFCFFNVSLHFLFQVMYCKKELNKDINLSDLANKFSEETNDYIAGKQYDIVGSVRWLLKHFKISLNVDDSKAGSWEVLLGYKSHDFNTENKILRIVGATDSEYVINSDNDIFCMEYSDKSKKNNQRSEKIQEHQTIPTLIGEFEISAIIIHFGSDNSGHYTIYRKGPNNLWFYCNDEIIETVSA